MSGPKRFVFDLNRCTGCGACIIGCATENYGKQDDDWRGIYTFNETRHPGLPLFHLSLACNHCEKPACKENCPALAYGKDADTGAVTHFPERCIGCKYCTWACPYDAPRYSKAKGIIEKCDFCIQRQGNGEAPACVCACPTNALRIEERAETEDTSPVTGFTDAGLKPAIRFAPLRNRTPEATAPPDMATVNELFAASQPVPPKKISLKQEWTLLLFTTIAVLLTAWLTASVGVPHAVNAYVFLGAGALGMLLSTAHLGKKFRAFRAVFNLKGSWLSREIFFFSLFMGLSALYLLFFPHRLLIGKLAVAAGFISLITIDRIYVFAMSQEGKQPLRFHSAQALLNGLFLTGILTFSGWIVSLMGALKLILYLHRKFMFRQSGRDIRWVISLVRVVLGFVLPLGLLVLPPEIILPYYRYVIIAVIIAEVIDRTEFYTELDVITPRKQIVLDVSKGLNLDWKD